LLYNIFSSTHSWVTIHNNSTLRDLKTLVDEINSLPAASKIFYWFEI